ncbi:MAG TPA: methyltransferase domain-containing protein [Phototrophicaceae bacterium]|jgi:ubiquinone/menaquinone biosynthesis C-methylase UbiE|nr:methyltransferase domain-containing protein [Phototrophicaceae bacterium]
MSAQIVIILLVALAVIALVGAAWWLLITTEGVYLGQHVVVWLYDLYASRYDNIKQFQPEYDLILLASPIMGEIAPKQDPLVLDVATGTGRLPQVLSSHPHFAGKIIAADLSRKMLGLAVEKLKDRGDQIQYVRCPAEKLPFADNTFDVVTCLEALEFTGDPALALREIVRVLRPGGLLLITNRINVRMPGRLWTDDELHALLESYGVGIAQTEPWQTDYHRVWGVKDLDDYSDYIDEPEV